MAPFCQAGLFGDVLKNDWAAVYKSSGGNRALLRIEHRSVRAAGGDRALGLRGLWRVGVGSLGARNLLGRRELKAERQDREAKDIVEHRRSLVVGPWQGQNPLFLRYWKVSIAFERRWSLVVGKVKIPPPEERWDTRVIWPTTNDQRRFKVESAAMRLAKSED